MYKVIFKEHKTVKVLYNGQSAKDANIIVWRNELEYTQTTMQRLDGQTVYTITVK